MLVNWKLCAIPSALLMLICQIAVGQQDEHGGVRSSELQQRDRDAISLLNAQQPRAIRKMSDNPGEKFWPHYWDLGDSATFSTGNTSLPENPLALHRSSTSLFGRALFGRDGACPTTPYNTSSCQSIGYPNSCCPVNTYCYGVTDTGNGPIGCCPNGGSCGSTIGNCPSGYTSCPNSTNKGCCIPGYTCSGSICVNSGTSTAIVSPSTTSTTSSVTTAAVISVTTVTLVNISPSGYTTTATVTVTQSASSTTASAIAPVIVISNSSSSTANVAPAGVSSTTTTITTASGSTSISTSVTTAAIGYCPTGYYMCSAIYLGGCCQVDRDCNTTYCPSTASTTVINGSPTVVAPTGASSNAGTCASGWYSCPASLGGNCCPSGYNCAQTNCPAVATGAASHDKQAPNAASRLNIAGLVVMTTIMTWIGMMIL